MTVASVFVLRFVGMTVIFVGCITLVLPVLVVTIRTFFDVVVVVTDFVLVVVVVDFVFSLIVWLLDDDDDGNKLTISVEGIDDIDVVGVKRRTIPVVDESCLFRPSVELFNDLLFSDGIFRIGVMVTVGGFERFINF